MNSEQLFRMLGDLDDAFIREAEAPERPTPLWKIVAATAAVAAAAVGLVWFSARLLHPAPLKAGPPELAAPVVTAAPQTPEPSPEPGGTATPAPDTGAKDPAPVTPDLPDTPAQTPAPLPTGSPDPQESDPSGQVSPPNGGLGWPTLPGSGSGLPGSGSGLPGFGGAAFSYTGSYHHTDTGDYLVFRSPVLGIPVVTVNITGQIIDGHYAGTVSGFPFGESCYVELQVYDNGTYSLQY